MILVRRKYNLKLFPAFLQEEEERRLNEEIERQQKEKLEQEESRRKEREEHLRQCGGNKTRRPTGYANKQTQAKFHTQSDLRHQSKTLRDHGLVMGHVNDQFFS